MAVAVTVGDGVAVGLSVAEGIALAASEVCVAVGPETLAGVVPPKGKPFNTIIAPPPQRLAR
ncbi:MAG TPA: hypothetical protein VFN11_14160, partial [Ktedonobacterales bacterium]|nr:hypothetical protein [Ktedonobacterales bacterium]